MKIKRGSTSVRRLIFIADSSSTTGAGLANLVYNTGSLVAYYFAGDLSNEVQITLATATLGTFASGGFVAVDNTNMPGWYEIGIPDVALDGGNECAIQLRGAANMVPVNIYIELDAIDYQGTPAVDVTKISGDSTAADNLEAAADGTGYNLGSGQIVAASVTGAVGSVTGAVGSVTGNLGGNVNGNVVGTVASVVGNLGGNVAGNVSGSVGSVTGAVGSVTGSVGSVVGNVGGSTASVAGAVGSVTGNVGGDVSGKVLGGGSGTISGDGVRAASVTGAVGSVTGSVGSVVGAVELDSADKATLVDLIWDEPLTGATHNVATSSGKRLRQTTAFQQIDSTVIDAAATTTTFITGLTSSVDNFYNDSMLVFTDGALAGQVRAIYDYIGATKTIVLEEALTSAPVNGVAFAIVSLHIHPVSQIQSGLATSAALATESTKINRIEAVATGTVTGAGTSTEVFVGPSATLTITVDSSGNRSAVVVT